MDIWERAVMILSVVAFTIAGNVCAAKTSMTHEEIELCTNAHNQHRALHVDTQPLEWDDSLAEKAQQHAEELVRINQQTSVLALTHSSTRLGENLCYMLGTATNTKETCAKCTSNWYKEIANYDYKTTESKNGLMVGHFTQVVWKETRKFGAGIATMKSRKYGDKYIEIFVVANYSPRGNTQILGRKFDYSRNVQPKLCVDADPPSCEKSRYLCNITRLKQYMMKFCKSTCNFCDLQIPLAKSTHTLSTKKDTRSELSTKLQTTHIIIIVTCVIVLVLLVLLVLLLLIRKRNKQRKMKRESRLDISCKSSNIINPPENIYEEIKRPLPELPDNPPKTYKLNSMHENKAILMLPTQQQQQECCYEVEPDREDAYLSLKDTEDAYLSPMNGVNPDVSLTED